MRDLGVPAWADRLAPAGRIRHLGFSFHDTYEAFVEIVDAYPWEFCQLQYNYVNQEVQAGTRGLRYAAAKGLGVIVMEPLFGGTLANPPPSVPEIWEAAGNPCSPVDLALRWVWNHPEVSLVLSGMSTQRPTAAESGQRRPSNRRRADSRRGGADRAGPAEYQRLQPIPCTKCGYCLPCPHGVNIPGNFELFNQAAVFQGNSRLLCRNLYLSLPEAQRAQACEACGTCEERCPQQIPIQEQLAASSSNSAESRDRT